VCGDLHRRCCWLWWCGVLVLLQYGSQDVQLSAAEQLVDRSQTRAVADAMKWLQARLKQQPQQHQQQQQQQQGKSLRQWLDELEAAFDQQVGFKSLHGCCSLGFSSLYELLVAWLSVSGSTTVLSRCWAPAAW